MYDPVDRHGSTTWVYSPTEDIKRLNKEVKRLEKENKQLIQQIKELQEYNNFILEGVVRHYNEELEKNQK